LVVALGLGVGFGVAFAVSAEMPEFVNRAQNITASQQLA
jgi:hypothetical protein